MRVSPREYARHNRLWQGLIPVSELQRLAKELQPNARDVEVELAFSMNEDQRIRVQGQATVVSEVACHRCLELRPATIKANIDALVVNSAELAAELAQEFDVIEIDDHEVAISELIEDDLILSIPWRICDQGEQCENYAHEKNEEREELDQSEETKRPFANLRNLLNQ